MDDAAAVPTSSFVDDDMEDDKGPLVCKKNAEEDIPLSKLEEKMKPGPRKSQVLTPEQLYEQIRKSRDKLFFISYTPDDGSGSKKKDKGEAKWYLVRVDLNTCDELDDTADCDTTGQYYVEFYNKAMGDKTKSDAESKWWLIWNTFRWTNGEMIIGTSLEFDPNTKQAVKRRLVELSKKSSTARAQDEIPHFEANLNKFTTYSDIVNLSDPKIRLLGPFDFEPVKPQDVGADLLSELGNVEPDAVFVRDRVPISQWTNLLKALKGSSMTLPTINKKVEKKSKPAIVEKKQAKKNCRMCGKVDAGQELIVFDATSSQSTLCVHKSCGLKPTSANERKVISTKEVSKLLDKALKSIRTSTASDGATYCVLDEFRTQFNLHLDRVKRNNNEAATATSEYPEVYPCSDFDDEELQKMPVVYAYFTKADDPSGVSERNAKIAKLDHDVMKRREKRRAREYAEELKKDFPHKVVATKSRSTTHSDPPEKTKQPPKQTLQSSEDDPLGLAEVNSEIGALSRIHAERVREKRRASSGNTPPKKAKMADDAVSTSLNERDASVETKKTSAGKIGAAKVYTGPHLDIPAEPAAPYLNIPDLPPGWVCRSVPRGGTPDVGGKALDRYYFSPGGRRFRSKPEVMRFLECVAASQGDESEAANLFGMKSKKIGRSSSVTNKTAESEGILVVDSKKDDGNIVEVNPPTSGAASEKNTVNESGKADVDPSKNVHCKTEETP